LSDQHSECVRGYPISTSLGVADSRRFPER